MFWQDCQRCVIFCFCSYCCICFRYGIAVQCISCIWKNTLSYFDFFKFCCFIHFKRAFCLFQFHLCNCCTWFSVSCISCIGIYYFYFDISSCNRRYFVTICFYSIFFFTNVFFNLYFFPCSVFSCFRYKDFCCSCIRETNAIVVLCKVDNNFTNSLLCIKGKSKLCLFRSFLRSIPVAPCTFIWTAIVI